MPTPSSPLDDVVAGATPGSIDYGAPLSPDEIAKQAGFRTGPAPALAPRNTLALPTRPRINAVTGTTELIPGGFDLLENLMKQFVLPAPERPPQPGRGVRG